MLKDLLNSHNNDYCIVGNSPCELGMKKGKEIDRHSIVIRFNDFSVDGKFKRDYGSKTNVWIRGTNDRLVYTMEKKKKLLDGFDLIILRAKDKRNHNFREYCDSNRVSYSILPIENEIELTKKLGHCPSTGLLTLFNLKKILGEISKERIYGFSFCKENRNKDKSGGQIHYYNKDDLVNPRTGKVEKIKETFLISKHNWQKEEEFFRKEILGS